MFQINDNKQQLVEDLLAVITKFPKIMMKRRAMTQKRSEIMVLFCLKKSGLPEMKVSEISRRLHVKAPTVTQLVNELEMRGQVERITRSSDRRSVWVRLTEEGEKLINKAKIDMQNTYSGLIEYLGEEESERLISSLNKVYTYFLEEVEKDEQVQQNGDGDKC